MRQYFRRKETIGRYDDEGVEYVQKINFALPPRLLRKIDEKRGDMPRTRFIARILEMALEVPEFDYYGNQAKAMRIANTPYGTLKEDAE